MTTGMVDVFPQERADWVDQACRIASEAKKDITQSELISMVRGLRWIKETDEAQSALDVLAGSKVTRDGVRVDPKRVEEIISNLCKFTDPEER